MDRIYHIYIPTILHRVLSASTLHGRSSAVSMDSYTSNTHPAINHYDPDILTRPSLMTPCLFLYRSLTWKWTV